MKYILDEAHNPVLVEDVLEWGRWFAKADRRVAVTELGEFNARISTVFLGIDHGFFNHEKPALFETMIFENGNGGDMRRYATWAEAEEGHKEMVREYIKAKS